MLKTTNRPDRELLSRAAHWNIWRRKSFVLMHKRFEGIRDLTELYLEGDDLALKDIEEQMDDLFYHLLLKSELCEDE